MNSLNQKITIAEFCGWVKDKDKDGFTKSMTHPIYGNAASADDLPDYLNDLNDIHAAEMLITDEKQMHIYFQFLEEVVHSLDRHRNMKQTFAMLCATAAQRAEALLKTIGKW